MTSRCLAVDAISRIPWLAAQGSFFDADQVAGGCSRGQRFGMLNAPFAYGAVPRRICSRVDQLRVKLGRHPAHPVTPVDPRAADELVHLGDVGGITAQRLLTLLEDRVLADE